ncbi:hypothetical protein [Bradyrhizobium campsiandrae]|uniref:hypothetical protein n=1 Tax=Bradyrhizobium campsiandrae TaxID=1729892 RepID=UPI001FCF0BB0|nr:hypothetical protein [Bradyrhizobium campsiandrae]
MSNFDKNDSVVGHWLPIQIAPDDCDLELGRGAQNRHPAIELSMSPQGRRLVQYLGERARADLAVALADLAIPHLGETLL